MLGKNEIADILPFLASFLIAALLLSFFPPQSTLFFSPQHISEHHRSDL